VTTPAVDLSYIKTLYTFGAWANARLIDAASSLSPADFMRDLKSSHGSIRDTFVHILFGEWVWLERWKGHSPATMLDFKAFPTLASIRERLEAVEEDRNAFLATLTPERIAAPVSYVNRKGETFAYPLWQQLVHVVNHGSYHRGQLATLLRQVGLTPPATDFLVFFDLSEA